MQLRARTDALVLLLLTGHGGGRHGRDGDADTDDEEEDDAPEPNTFWVEKADLLETIDRKHVKAALRARHNAVLDGL